MKILARLLILLAVLVSPLAAHANWTQVINDNFTRANTSPGGAGTTTGAGNNWIDEVGGIFSISSNTLLGSTSGASYATQLLERPVGEAAVGQRITVNFTAPQAANAGFGVGLRVQSTAGNYYMVELESGSTIFKIYSIVGSTATVIFTSSAFALTSGHNYLLDFYTSGASPTTLAATITDVTTSTQVATGSVSDNSAALQSAGTYGILFWSINASSTSQNVTNATTYTGSPPSSASIAISPTSTAGNTLAAPTSSGVTLTVTGTSTSFTGTPFSITGGYGASIISQSVSSSTVGSVTLYPGYAGNGNITVTDTISGATATLTISTPAAGTFKIGWIGDSITSGTNGAPVTQAAATLGAMGYTVTSTNEGISATSTADWVCGGADMNAALSAFSAAGTTIVHVMLGTNDVRTPNSFSLSAHFANIANIVNCLRAAGYKVIISKPIFSMPNAGSGGAVWPNDPNSVYLQYFQKDMTLVDGVNIFQGDTTGFAQSSLNPTTFLAADGVHPANSTENNLLGTYWATAIVERFGNPQTKGGGYMFGGQSPAAPLNADQFSGLARRVTTVSRPLDRRSSAALLAGITRR